MRSISRDGVTMCLISTSGEWLPEEKSFSYDDITRIDFSGEYAEGLWSYAEYLRTKESGAEEEA